MKFQVGDKVLVKHTNEEAEIVEIINKQMVMLEVKGVKFPAYMDQIDFPYFKRFTEKKLFPEAKKQKTFIDEVKKEKTVEKKVVDGVWLTFIAVMEADEFGDGAKSTRVVPLPRSFVDVAGMLLTAICPVGTVACSVKVALCAGSSHDGIMRRASEFSNCVNSARLAPAAVS